MDSYNYKPNGIDYDPDLLYTSVTDGPQYPQQQPPERQRRRRQAAPVQDEDALPPQQTRQRRSRETGTAPQVQPQPQAQGRKTRQTAPQKPETAKTAEMTERKPISEWGIVKFITDKRTRAVFGVILICVAVYVVIAALSFFRSGAEDQSAVAGRTAAQVVESGTKVTNSGGALGATLSQAIFSDGLGLGALAGVVYLVLMGLSLMGIRKCNFWSMTFKTLLVAVTVSIVFGLVTLSLGTDINLGGNHGLYMNQLIISYANWIGAVLVSVVLIVAVTYVYLNDIVKLISKYRAVRNARRAKAEQAELEQREARERVRKAMESSQLTEEEETTGESSDTTEAETAETPAQDPAPGLMSFEEEETEETSSEDDTAVTVAEGGEEQQAEVEHKPEAEDVPLGGAVKIRRGGITASLGGFAETDAEDDDPDAVPSSRNEVYEPETGTEEERQAAYLDHPDLPPSPAGESDNDKTDAEQQNKTVALSDPGFEVVTQEIEKADKPQSDLYDPTAELSHYKAPGLDLLHEVPEKTNVVDIEEQDENKKAITDTLRSFEIEISDIQATVGPTVTLYEIKLAEGVRIAKVKRLEDDIAMSLAALGIRIIAPIPGKNTIGIEVPNKDPQTVSIKSILGSKAYQDCHMKLPMAMGATIANDVYIADLTKMPHLLVAGATGMGKSVGLNTIIASLLYKKHPAELKFVLVDPKMVELSLYSALERHFLAKLPDDDDAVITDMDKVVRTLNSLCIEMDNRYMLLRDANVRSITEYNERFVQKRLNPEKGHRFLPYIVMIVDEFADLIMTAGKQVETPIARIAQKARAVGMHLIVATQRPSTNVITGIIKANFPGRIAFRVNQMVDSRTILDCPGANQLIGRGDMIFSHNGKMERVQCAFIDTDEVVEICKHISSQVGYEHAYYLPEPQLTDDEAITSFGAGDRDPLFEECAAIVVQTGQASTSNLQRRYSIGYNRAGKIMDQLEQAGIVGPSQGAKPRQVLIDSIQLARIIHNEE